MAKNEKYDTFSNDDSEAQSSLKKPSVRLLSFQDLPTWQKENEFIFHGYRPEFKNTLECVNSLYYMHNETINIYTHLIPGIVMVLAEGLFSQYLDTYYPNATQWDRAVFGFFIFTAVVLFLMSSAYHTMYCHSEDVSYLWLKIDFIGIVTLMIGDFVSGIYFIFYCEPHLQRLYWTMIFTLGFLCFFILLNPRFQGPRYRKIRIFTFVSTGLSGFAPIIHGVWLFGVEKMMLQSGMPFYIVEGFFLLSGVVFYATRFPESRWPGKFDIWFSSHQIFHVLVVLATLVQCAGIILAFDYNYMHRQCTA
ncbi:hypothetical protein TWF694_002986 [Orbilia ellipsospora]|uniref:Uncharacterized protein n=1 Tax=Orbilia ellipsospora TaxID=2528407 RepID=A0AAV9X159_9PEZI